MKLGRPCPVHVGEGAAPGSICASVELTVEEWESITHDLRSDSMFDTTSDEPELPLRERIGLLFKMAFAQWERTNDQPVLDELEEDDELPL